MALRRLVSLLPLKVRRGAAGMTLKTLIVDDEPIARKVLREELELLDDVE